MYPSSSATYAPNAGLIVFYLFAIALWVVAMWKMFVKAGQPGWAAIVPFYNTYILLKVCGRPAWWLLWFFIPVANLVVSAIIAMDLAKSFGKSTAFGIVALFIFSIVGHLILGLGKDTYIGPGGVAASKTPAAPAAPSASAAA